MSFIKSIVISFLLLVCLPYAGNDLLHCTQEVPLIKTEAQIAKKNIVLCFDIDDVISGKEKIGFTDYITLVPRILFKAPKVITAIYPKNSSKIRARAAELEKSSNGASNIIHTMIVELKEQGYGDLSSFECEFVQRSLKPFLIKRMIDNVRKLKAQGYTVIGATNQDWHQHTVYRKKFKRRCKY